MPALNFGASAEDRRLERADGRRRVIIELLEYARGLAADEDELAMAGHIDEAIVACCRHQLTLKIEASGSQVS